MKDLFLVGGLCVTAIVAGLLLYFYGSTLLSSRGEEGVAFRSLTSGAYAVSVDAEKNYRLTSRDELAALWGLVYGKSQPSIPSVNFDVEEVLAVFGGTHSSGGYAIKVTKIIDTELARTVYIEQTEPAENCPVASSVTSPYELIVLPKLEGSKKLTHIDTVVTKSCD